MTLRGTILAGVAGAALVAACSELGTNPKGVVSIELLPPGMPAVVLGDTLRDTTGAVAPLRAVVLNADGDTITDAPLRFYVLTNRDSAAVTVDSLTGVVVGDSVATGVRVIAQSSGLQPFTTLTVTRRPDTVIAARTPRDTIVYQFGDTAKTGAELGLRVVHGALPGSTGDTSGVLGWIVSYQVLYNGVSDTTFAVIVAPGGSTRTSVDTTSSTPSAGYAARAVLAKPVRIPNGGIADSVIVRATVKYHGQQVAGSPLDFTVIIQPASTR